MRIREHKILTLLFDTAMFFFGIFSLPHFWMKSKQAADRKKFFCERLGRLEYARPSGKRLIWIHAVSVGEVAAVKKFVEGIRANFPGTEVLVSTVTPTGQAMAESFRPFGCKLIYFPFDISFIVRHVLCRINPDLILLAETEIWPNFILQAKALGIPAGIINGRISAKSLSGYRKAAFLIRPVFESLEFLLVQTEEDKERYCQLGVDSSKVHVLGNMKFDQTEISEEDSSIKIKLGYDKEDQVLIAGSTHSGEEKLVFEAVKVLRREFPNLKVLIAPRHPERAVEVAEEARKTGFQPKFYSSADGTISDNQALIIDQIGVLKKIYPASDLVVMGGSFIPHGGQNPIEPSACARPVLSGPYISNFHAVYDVFVSAGSALIITEGQLVQKTREILSDDLKRKEMGHQGLQVVLKQRGATERHLNWIKNLITQEDLMHA